MITIENVIENMQTDCLIVQSYAYKKRGGRFWVIIEPINIKLTNGDIINIHKGFYYDMATVPPFIWSLIKPYDDGIIAYLIHDYLYIFQKKHSMNRKMADYEMLIWANKTNKNFVSNVIRYTFVRIFGWLYWKKII